MADLTTTPSGQLVEATLGGGVVRSVDDGLAWVAVGGCNCGTIQVLSTSVGLVMVGSVSSMGTFARSVDGGATWVQTNFSPSGLGVGGLIAVAEV